MNLAKVVGNVVSTQKNQKLNGKKLLLVLPIDTQGNSIGSEVLAVDGVGAGVGDIVLIIAEGGSARSITHSENLSPIDLAIAGIVDEVKSKKGNLKI